MSFLTRTTEDKEISEATVVVEPTAEERVKTLKDKLNKIAEAKKTSRAKSIQ